MVRYICICISIFTSNLKTDEKQTSGQRSLSLLQTPFIHFLIMILSLHCHAIKNKRNFELVMQMTELVGLHPWSPIQSTKSVMIGGVYVWSCDFQSIWASAILNRCWPDADQPPSSLPASMLHGTLPPNLYVIDYWKYCQFCPTNSNRYLNFFL